MYLFYNNNKFSDGDCTYTGTYYDETVPQKF